MPATNAVSAAALRPFNGISIILELSTTCLIVAVVVSTCRTPVASTVVVSVTVPISSTTLMVALSSACRVIPFWE